MKGWAVRVYVLKLWHSILYAYKKIKQFWHSTSILLQLYLERNVVVYKSQVQPVAALIPVSSQFVWNIDDEVRM